MPIADFYDLSPFKLCDTTQRNKSIIDHFISFLQKKTFIYKYSDECHFLYFQQKWATSSDPFLEFNLR